MPFAATIRGRGGTIPAMSGKPTVAQPCREVKLASLEDLEREIERVENAYVAGTLSTCGNWSAGKILGHLASWIDYAYDGYPMRFPWFVRLMGRVLKDGFLRKSAMPPGVRIPGAPDGTYGLDEMDVPEGAARLRAALERLRAETPGKHPVLGPLTPEQWTKLHLSHAALHLGFVRV